MFRFVVILIFCVFAGSASGISEKIRWLSLTAISSISTAVSTAVFFIASNNVRAAEKRQQQTQNLKKEKSQWEPQEINSKNKKIHQSTALIKKSQASIKHNLDSEKIQKPNKNISGIQSRGKNAINNTNQAVKQTVRNTRRAHVPVEHRANQDVFGKVHQYVFLQSVKRGETKAEKPWAERIKNFTFHDKVDMQCEYTKYTPSHQNQRNNKVAIVYFGGVLTDNMINKEYLQDISDYGNVVVYTMNYPGFGYSEGTPSFRKSVNSGIAFAKRIQAAGYNEIIPVGHSFGGAVATQVAKEVESPALVISSSFTSVKNVSNSLTQHIAEPLINRYLSDRLLNTQSTLAQINHPMKVIITHGKKDKIIDYSHALELKSSAEKNKHLNVNFYTVDEGGHSCTTTYYKKMPNHLMRLIDLIWEGWGSALDE